MAPRGEGGGPNEKHKEKVWESAEMAGRYSSVKPPTPWRSVGETDGAIVRDFGWIGRYRIDVSGLRDPEVRVIDNTYRQPVAVVVCFWLMKGWIRSE